MAYHNGAPITLSNVADVVDSVEDLRNIGFVNNKRAVIVRINRQPGANIVDTVDRILEVLPSLKASLPASMDITILSDRTTTIRASVRTVEQTMAISVSLVIMVVFIFLRSIPTTLIPTVVVPTSLVGTFGLLYLFGYSVDNLSLMALTIATGFVVDDAIVVIENITRHMEHGLPPMQAALKGASEIGFTVMTISMSLIAVFIPILMMAGLVGRLFRELAVTISVAIVLSLAMSLSMTPMMCARLPLPGREEDHGPLYRFSGWIIDVLRRGYSKTLGWVLEHQPVMLTVTLSTVALSVYLYIIIPKGFFPQQDQGRINGSIVADQATSFQAMQGRAAQLVNLVLQDPAVENLNAQVGGQGGGGGNINTGRP